MGLDNTRIKLMVYYYYVEDIDTSLVVVHMLQTCKKYFSVPMVVECEELRHKLENLDKLLKMWTEGSIENSSYQSEVYKRICGTHLYI